jgi:hypothetical protein
MKKHAVGLLALALLGGASADGRSRDRQPSGRNESAPTQAEQLAWECVPSYWWGYWTWAWQPCAWLDREYVEGTIGAIADATPSDAPARPNAE